MNHRPLFLLFLLAACGTEDPNPGKKDSLFPVAVGNKWVYRIQDADGEQPIKTQTVTGTAADGAFTFETVRGLDGQRESESVQKIDEEGRLVRLSERSIFGGNEIERITYVPNDIRVDTNSYEIGAQYSQTYTEDHDPSYMIPDITKTQTFTVEEVDEVVTVPAGTFRCIKIRRTSQDGPAKTYWYAIGVGKVQEIGGQNEQLTTVEIEGVQQ